MSLRNSRECAQRAQEHEAAAHLFAQSQNEWAAVCFFYSAYHYMRGALISDPVFGELTRLQSIKQDLIPDDRYAAKHQGRRGTGRPEFGVNDLVRLLYGSFSISYEALHQASLDVRYYRGFKGNLGALEGHLTAIREAATTGQLVA